MHTYTLRAGMWNGRCEAQKLIGLCAKTLGTDLTQPTTAKAAHTQFPGSEIQDTVVLCMKHHASRIYQCCRLTAGPACRNEVFTKCLSRSVLDYMPPQTGAKKPFSRTKGSFFDTLPFCVTNHASDAQGVA